MDAKATDTGSQAGGLASADEGLLYTYWRPIRAHRTKAFLPIMLNRRTRDGLYACCYVNEDGSPRSSSNMVFVERVLRDQYEQFMPADGPLGDQDGTSAER